ncbi:ArsR/SmtB family transcription factor [Fructilactobacillus sp. Tb1]|uniref:ArsR/SmtB family transcription factor n=1 Tax=Fructilactobacillus sp. Tb1 TaxID=3422304 RepID=UPI003D297375
MKTNFDEQLLPEMNKIYKVLSNPTRVKLLYLLEDNEMTVNEIAEKLDLAQSVVSHQLAILREHQLISFHKKGKYVSYSLDDPHILCILDCTYDHVRHVVKGEPHQYELEIKKL